MGEGGGYGHHRPGRSDSRTRRCTRAARGHPRRCRRGAAWDRWPGRGRHTRAAGTEHTHANGGETRKLVRSLPSLSRARFPPTDCPPPSTPVLDLSPRRFMPGLSLPRPAAALWPARARADPSTPVGRRGRMWEASGKEGRVRVEHKDTIRQHVLTLLVPQRKRDLPHTRPLSTPPPPSPKSSFPHAWFLLGMLRARDCRSDVHPPLHPPPLPPTPPPLLSPSHLAPCRARRRCAVGGNGG